MEYLNLFKIFKIYYLFLCEFLIPEVLFSTVTLKSVTFPKSSINF